MEFKTDVVDTCSSSSSFLICHNATLTQNQEKLLEKWVYRFLERELITISEAEYLKTQAFDMIKNELSNGLQILTEEELREIFEQHKFENVVNKHNFFLKRLGDGKCLTKVSIDRDLLSLNKFRNICNILSEDEEFDFIEEKEEF